MKLDPLGIVTLISAFVCLTFALQWADTSYPWSSPHIWGCLTGFGLLLCLFLADQIWRKDESDFR